MKINEYWKKLKFDKSGIVYEENWNVFLKWLEEKLFKERRR
ncbi:hypothetical protein [Radiobacillus kanasensis]|nr:hypothetical protein [Radiobacillus kanasensis]